jgi:osmotically-inducible protein OsmY
MNPYINVVAAFAAGAAAAWCLGGVIMRHRTPLRESDAQLRERVRKRLAGLVSHPDAVEVSVEEGVVRVSGRVLSHELDGLLMRVKDLPGVHRVYNALSTLDDAA